jgi:hypothetical protein
VQQADTAVSLVARSALASSCVPGRPPGSDATAEGEHVSRSSLAQKRRRPARTAALVTGIALAALTLSTGGASATTPAGPPPVADHVTRLICTELAGVIGQLPPESAPVRVCKLVNGWD